MRPTRLQAIVVAVTALAAAPAAFGQTWEPPTPAECPESSTDAEAARELAGGLFADASRRHDAGSFAEAIALFSCSYHVVPHPNTLYNLGVSAQRADELDLAEHALERYLEDADPDSPYRQDAEVQLTVVRVRRAAIEAPSGGPQGMRDVVDRAMPEGSATAHTPGLEIAGWNLVGVGVVLAVAGGTGFAVLAADEADRAATAETWAEAGPHRDDYETYTGLEIAFFAAGGAVAATGVVLLLLDAYQEHPPAATVIPLVAPDSVGLGAIWRF